METLSSEVQKLIDEGDYKAAKELFVINETPSNLLEVNAVVFMAIPFYILYQYVFAFCIKKNIHIWYPTFKAKFMLFLIENVFFVIFNIFPMILPQYQLYFYIAPLILSMILAEYLRRHPVSKEARAEVAQNPNFAPIDLNDKVKSYFTVFRGDVMVMTVVAIMAVDFTFFPRRQAKTLKFGCSLMDLGVGTFVINSGMVARQIRTNKVTFKTVLSSLSSVSPLLVLGILRFIFVTLTNYQHVVTEYGVHWNFFFTLAGVAVFSAIFSIFMRSPISIFIFILALVSGYQYWLCNGGTEYLLNDVRTTLFDQNKEGIMSCIGYFAIYSAGILLGKTFLGERTRPQWKKYIIFYMLTMLLVWIAAFLVSFYIELPSRRTANLAYVLFSIATGSTSVGCCLIIHYCFEYLYVPVIYQSINYNQLAIFLLANVMCGLVNFMFKTLLMDHLQSFIIVSIYSVIIALVAYVLYEKKIKIKFW